MDKTAPPIVRRRVKIDFDQANAGRWSRDSREFENCLNAMSFFFPAGEGYFINSVQNVMDRITDPELKEQARRFIYQEAMHTKEHVRSNELLKKVHSYGEMMEKYSVLMLAPSRRFMPKSTQLATSCAMEHFTAMFADSILREQDHVIASNDPAFASLWLWHAVEETEHKAVCFDVYEHIYGKGLFAYLQRVLVMGFVSLAGLAALGAAFSLIKFKHWRETRNAPQVAKASESATAENFAAPKLSGLLSFAPLNLYVDYYRRRFHPWDHKNGDLIEKWKEKYADFGEVRELGAAGPSAA